MNINGIILAGGYSSRMGQNKSLLKIGNRTIIEIIAEKMKPIFPEVLIITNNPDEYEFLKLEIHEDIYPHMGPLSGIHSGLVNSKAQSNFFVSCDSPCFTRESINFMIAKYTGAAAMAARGKDRSHYLFGIYSKECIPVLESSLKNNELRVSNFFDKMNGIEIPIEECESYSGNQFLNINTLEDYEKLREVLRS
ncbi:MAG: molybdenum cofactor guanylyltransferase [Ignavibacteriaceae bacterium]